MQHRLGFAMALGLVAAIALPARVVAAAPASGPARAERSETPASLLAAADAAVGAGNLALAHSLFARLAAQFPEAPEASEARRALSIIAVSFARPVPPSVPGARLAPPAESGRDGDVIIRNEPYSLKTSERLRLTIWEKVDFGVTAFLYGMSVGFSLALSHDTRTASDVLTPVALGAVAYTLGAVGFLKLTNPDRGDLPLALAITSYVPTTTLLVMTALDPHPNGHTTGAATALAGLLSVPVAVIAARHLDLDPGDTQLVRDAGFWGLALATIGTLGFGGSTTSEYGYSQYHSPSGQRIALAGLLGLYGGLGLGLLAAKTSEVSLERVRVSTWGGYGGAVVGLLLGAAADNGHEQGVYEGATIGALAGLLVTFVSTGSLDGIPNEEPTSPLGQSWRRRLVPTIVQMADADGRPRPGFGLGGRY
jgi:hypothetical protein